MQTQANRKKHRETFGAKNLYCKLVSCFCCFAWVSQSTPKNKHSVRVVPRRSGEQRRELRPQASALGLSGLRTRACFPKAWCLFPGLARIRRESELLVLFLVSRLTLTPRGN